MVSPSLQVDIRSTRPVCFPAEPIVPDLDPTGAAVFLKPVLNEAAVGIALGH